MRLLNLFVCACLSICLLSGCGSPAGETSQAPTTSQSVTSSEGELMEETPAVDTSSSQDLNPQKDNPTDTSWQEKISMTATADASGAVTVTITNDSDQTITAGEAYELQRLEGTDWTDVPLSLVFTDVGIDIPAGGNHDFEYTMSLEAGSTYQVIKKVYVDQSEQTLTASFTLP